MEDGRIVQQGMHDKLMVLPGPYGQQVAAQLGPRLPDALSSSMLTAAQVAARFTSTAAGCTRTPRSWASCGSAKVRVRGCASTPRWWPSGLVAAPGQIPKAPTSSALRADVPPLPIERSPRRRLERD
jgi:hypothetical protein